MKVNVLAKQVKILATDAAKNVGDEGRTSVIMVRMLFIKVLTRVRALTAEGKKVRVLHIKVRLLV